MVLSHSTHRVHAVVTTMNIHESSSLSLSATVYSMQVTYSGAATSNGE